MSIDTALLIDVTLVRDAHTTDNYADEVLTAAKRIEYHNEILDDFRTKIKPTSEVTF